MTQDTWTAVDAYHSDLFIPSDPALDAALKDSEDAGLPAIQVMPSHGKLLHILARAIHAQRILEIGTLGGYSTIWLARALPAGGSLITLEADPRHAAIARKNLQRAGVDKVAQVREGLALDSLPKLQAEGAAPFDLVFIDADKENNINYLEWALKLTHVGSLIITDNVVRGGKVTDPANTDSAIVGTRQFNKKLAGDPRLLATSIQTVGFKGYDGMSFALVVAE